MEIGVEFQGCRCSFGDDCVVLEWLGISRKVMEKE